MDLKHMGISLWKRRIIYLVFMVVFLVSLPFIFLYAQGYKYNFKKGHWQKTGVIFIDCRPKEVNIFVNSKWVKDKTPARIRGLLPNDYELKISKTGYYSWQKKIKVNEGQTSFLQSVRLFKKDKQPKQIYKDKFKAIIYSPEKNIFALETDYADGIDKIILFKPEENKINEVLNTQDKVEKINFLEQGRRLMVKTNKNIWLIETDSFDKYNLNQLAALFGAKNIKINPKNSNYIYYIKQNRLYAFNLISRKQELLLPYSVTDYLIDDGELYYLSTSGLKNLFLNRISLSDLEQDKMPERLIVLPQYSNYKLTTANRNFIVLSDLNKQKLILLNKHNQQIKDIRNVTYFKWSADQSQLIYGNTIELWVLKAKDNGEYENILITRNSQGISNGVWLPKMTHIIYGAGNKIKVTENLAWNRQTTDLYVGNKIKQIMLNKKGNKLFFVSSNKQSDKGGLFEIIIQ